MPDRVPVLMVPGMACDDAVFGPQVEVLVGRADLRPELGSIGRGRSIHEMARHVLAVAPDRFVLVGFSMGGYVALDIALAAPDRLVGLIMISSSARADPIGMREARLRIEDRVRQGELADVARESARALVASSSTAGRAVADVVEAMTVRTGPDAYVRHSRAVRTRTDRRPELRHLGVPVLALAGRDDRAVPPKLALEIANAVPFGRAEVIDGAGHMLPLERPSDVADHVIAFARECVDRRLAKGSGPTATMPHRAADDTLRADAD